MEEKIGMEKLIELLNEYEEKENLNMYEWEIEGQDILAYSKFRDGYETINVGESIIISKWYEFIKWLVENDKIDTEKEIKNSELNWLHEHYFREDCLLMLLAIQDEPIRFLCEILK